MAIYNKKRIADLKSKGFLLQNDREHYAIRFLTKAGNIAADDIQKISLLANKYGRGYMGFTTRLQIEVPWIKDSDVEALIDEAKSLGLRHGGTGKKVRSLVACKGTICLHGNIDTQGICNKLENKYFSTEVPSKCKIGISGCANNCGKANINDIGIIGQSIPKYNVNKCVGCGMCISVCRQKALALKDNKIEFNPSKCVNCGDCIRECKLGGFTTKASGAEISIGGRFGRSYSIGKSLGKLFKEDEIVPMVDKILESYRTYGKPGERICHLMERMGEEEFMDRLLK